VSRDGDNVRGPKRRTVLQVAEGEFFGVIPVAGANNAVHIAGCHVMRGFGQIRMSPAQVDGDSKQARGALPELHQRCSGSTAQYSPSKPNVTA
jgi:hypothetical protein